MLRVMCVCVTVAEDEGEGMLGPRQSSLNTAMDCKIIKANKKKPGLLKGIGSMFRLVVR